MISAGLDIGSRTIKLVLWENGKIIAHEKRENSMDPLAVCHEML